MSSIDEVKAILSNVADTLASNTGHISVARNGVETQINRLRATMDGSSDDSAKESMIGALLRTQDLLDEALGYQHISRTAVEDYVRRV